MGLVRHWENGARNVAGETHVFAAGLQVMQDSGCSQKYLLLSLSFRFPRCVAERSRGGTRVTCRHPRILLAWWEDAVWLPTRRSKSSGCPSAPADATPQAEGGDNVHAGRMQLLIFLIILARLALNSRSSSGFCLHQLIPVPCSTAFVKPHQVFELYPSNFFFDIRIKIFHERQLRKVI